MNGLIQVEKFFFEEVGSGTEAGVEAEVATGAGVEIVAHGSC